MRVRLISAATPNVLVSALHAPGQEKRNEKWIQEIFPSRPFPAARVWSLPSDRDDGPSHRWFPDTQDEAYGRWRRQQKAGAVRLTKFRAPSGLVSARTQR